MSWSSSFGNCGIRSPFSSGARSTFESNEWGDLLDERRSNDSAGAVRWSAVTLDFADRTGFELNLLEINPLSETGCSRVLRVCSIRLIPVFIAIGWVGMTYSIRCLRIGTS